MKIIDLLIIYQGFTKKNKHDFEPSQKTGHTESDIH